MRKPLWFARGIRLAQYDYMGDGTIVKVTHPETYLGLQLSYGTPASGYADLDQFGRVLTQDWTVGADNILVDGYAYTYDAAGNVATKTNQTETNGSLDETYTYDGLDRLIDTTRGGTDYQNWTLDQEGNWSSSTSGGTAQTRTADAANEIATVSGQGNPVYDADGNLKSDGANFTYTYDAWNRLVQVNDRNSDGSTGNLVATYGYDGNGYRISKAVALYGNSESPDTITGYDRTDYYYQRQLAGA